MQLNDSGRNIAQLKTNPSKAPAKKVQTHGRNVSLPRIGQSKTLLSNTGANILKTLQSPEPERIEIKKNYLRKRMGFGGSPTEFEQKFREVPSSIDTKISAQQLVPVRRNNNTTIRVRNKDASFQYGEGSINGAYNANSSMMSQTNVMWEKKRAKMEKLEAYRE